MSQFALCLFVVHGGGSIQDTISIEPFSVDLIGARVYSQS